MATARQAIKATVEAGETPKAFGGKNGHPEYSENLNRVESGQDRRTRQGQPFYGAEQGSCCAYCGKLCVAPRVFAYVSAMNEFSTPELSEGKDQIGNIPVCSDCASALKKTVPLFDAETFERINPGVPVKNSDGEA